MSNWEKIKTVKNFITGGGATVFIELLNKPRLGGPLDVRVRAKVGDQVLKATAVYLHLQSVEKIRVRHGSTVRVSTRRTSAGRVGAYRTDTTRRTVTWETEALIVPIDGLEAHGAFEWDGELHLPDEGSPSYYGIHAKHIWQVRGCLTVTGKHPKSKWLEFPVKG